MTMTKIIVRQLLTVDQARVLQVKDDSIPRHFYVHFMDYEKRMDRWIEEKFVLKNLGNVESNAENKKLKKNNLPITNKFLYNEKKIVTRKKSLSKGIHEEEVPNQ